MNFKKVLLTKTTATEITKAILLIAISVMLRKIAALEGSTDSDLPEICNYFDTVNVTGDMKFPNGSYLHDGILLPTHLVRKFDYVYTNLEERVQVTPHWRGCICKLKTCINICCPWGMIFNADISRCVNITGILNGKLPQPLLNITTANGGIRQVNIYEQFTVLSFRPCSRMYSLQPEIDDFAVFENGTLLRVDDHKLLDKNKFCLVPDIRKNFHINPANCDLTYEFATIKIVNVYAMLFSIPFMVLTIVVYMAVPELSNRHGKSLVSYLLGLIVGYSMLCTIALANTLKARNLPCKIIGYIAYYFFMSAFLWLSVISFDLWHNFRGTRNINRVHENKRFLHYSLYSWGMASIFLLLTWYMQEQTSIPEHLKPGIGGSSDYCWIDMNNWSAMIYFFFPIIVIICANTIMFIMTAVKIHKVQQEMARITARDDSNRNLRSEKDKFGLFLRLFIVMGVTWSMEILSYFVGADKKWSKIFYVTDFCNAMQGFLIFMLFVMKKKVKHLLTTRYSSKRKSSQQRPKPSTTGGMPNLINLSIINKQSAVKSPLDDRDQTTTIPTNTMNLKYN